MLQSNLMDFSLSWWIYSGGNSYFSSQNQNEILANWNKEIIIEVIVIILF